MERMKGRRKNERTVGVMEEGTDSRDEEGREVKEGNELSTHGKIVDGFSKRVQNLRRGNNVMGQKQKSKL